MIKYKTASDLTPEALTPENAATLMSCGRSTVWKLMESGELPYARIGNRRLIRVTTIRKFLADREAEPKSGQLK